MHFYLKTKTNNLPILLMQYNKNNNNLIFPASITKEKKIYTCTVIIFTIIGIN